MFQALTFSLIFAIFFPLLGAPWLLLFTKHNWQQFLLISGLLGCVISLTASSLVLMAGGKAQVALFVILGAALAGWAAVLLLGLSGRKNQRGQLRFNISRILPYSLLSFPIIAYSFLSSGGLFAPGFSFRVGPDNFGWAISAKVLCQGETLGHLSDKVQEQLGSTPLFSSLEHPLSSPRFTSIVQIPSFTDQAAFEFLIGAHRTGAPGFLGGLCGLGAENLLTGAFLGLICWALFMFTVIVYRVSRTYELSRLSSAAIALVLSSSFSIFSVGLEGGYGQILTLPYFAFALMALTASKPNYWEIWFSLLLLLAISFSTYLDVMFFAIPFFLVIALFRIIRKEIHIHWLSWKQSVILLSFIILAILPLIFDFWRLALFPLMHPTAGGWDQGRVPFPANIFGLSPWLPDGYYEITDRSQFDFVVDIALSVLLLLMLIIGGFHRNIAFSLGLLALAYLQYSVYFNPDPVAGVNNYRLWKYGPYAVTTMAFLVASGLSGLRSRRPRQNFQVRAFSRLGQMIAIVLLCASLTSSVLWSSEWLNSRRVFMPSTATNSILEYESKYDLIVDGSDGVEILQEWAFQGNLHYGLSSRGWGLETHRSVPSRPLVIIRSLMNDCDLKSAREMAGVNVESLRQLEKTPWFISCIVTFDDEGGSP
jgi:hypothetical protein